jgi:arylsulfatase A-like enzyme
MTKVLVVVFDGLQPAQVTGRLTPNLAAFAASGVVFADHHAVYPSVTRANASSMVTGRHPGGHGISANTLLVAEYDQNNPMPALKPQLEKLAQRTGSVQLAPTLGEILCRHGQEYVAIGVGTSGNAYLHNPAAETRGGATIHPDFTLPRALNEDIVARYGAWPAESRPNTPRMAHAVRVLKEYILGERNPSVALIWSSEPDKSQHDSGVGSELSDAAVFEADAQFGEILGWLDKTGKASETDVMVVSDHGYSTIGETVQIEARAREAGFSAGGEPGGVVVASNGGAVLFYSSPWNRETVVKLVKWLMAQSWCGNLTVGERVGPIAGTLPAALVGGEGRRAPDVAMSFRWSPDGNPAGYGGTIFSTGGVPGQGQHGSMGRSELHNVLFARGPSFKEKLVVDVPSGNIDLAPTILQVLGLPPEQGMEGRALVEAMAGGPEPLEVEWSSDFYSTDCAVGEDVYRQQITLSRVGETVYVHEGNSSLGPR